MEQTQLQPLIKRKNCLPNSTKVISAYEVIRMIIVGELINASRKAIKAAIENQDADIIKQIAIDQNKAARIISMSMPVCL